MNYDSDPKHFLFNSTAVGMLTDYASPIQFPLVSIVRNALSLMTSVSSLPEMAVLMIRGLSAHLSTEQRHQFGRNVSGDWWKVNCQFAS
jgi:hypothetical protein